MTKGVRGSGGASGARGREVLDGPRDGRTVLEGPRGRGVTTGPRGRVTGGGGGTPPELSYFTGGTITDDATHRYHTFNISGTLVLVGPGPVAVEYMVVAGGGGGGSHFAGGGGAGGMLAASASLGETQTIVIGAGGPGGTYTMETRMGGDGSPSSLGAIATVGGGGGATRLVGSGAGRPGGSGGGGGNENASNPGGSGTPGQGHNGGAGIEVVGGSPSTGGGGGGAGGVGADGVADVAGVGGPGVAWGGSTYAVGGTGATNDEDGNAPSPNTGGGGGGGQGSRPGFVGGSGKVIVRYLKKAGMPDLPPFPNDMIAGWWDAADAASFEFSSGNVVSQWKDKSGKGRHVTQATVSDQPTLSGVQNGKSTLAFAGSQYLGATIDAGSVIGPTAFSVFSVFKKTGAVNTYESYPVTFQPILDAYKTIRETGSQTNGFPNMETQTAWTQFCLVASQVSLSMTEYKDGVQTFTVGAQWPPLTQQALRIATRADHIPQFTGEIAELIVFDKILSDADRQQVESYLRTKWGTP